MFLALLCVFLRPSRIKSFTLRPLASWSVCCSKHLDRRRNDSLFGWVGWGAQRLLVGALRQHCDNHAMTERFQLVAPYQPAGDQPAAIARLIDGFEAGVAQQTLLGEIGRAHV